MKWLEKGQAIWISDIISDLMGDPKLKLIVKKSLLYEMAKNQKEFEKLSWWDDFLDKQMQLKREDGIPSRVNL